MTQKFCVSIDLGFTIPPAAAFDSNTFPNLASAVKMIALQAETLWKSYAQGAPLPDGKTINDRTGTYLRSITMTMTSDFSAVIYSNAPYAEAIERGSPAWDMKSMLNSSLKVRIAKDGSRYLIIPFRYNAPDSVMGNTMPLEVHNWWLQGGRDSSSITGTYRRVSGTGALDIKSRKPLTVPGWTYHWGTKLTENYLDGLGFTEKDRKRYAGMVQFRNPEPKKAGHNTQYLNFRVMSEKSTGWIRKAQPGRYPARTVAESIEKDAEQVFKAAAEADIAAWLQKALGG